MAIKSQISTFIDGSSSSNNNNKQANYTAYNLLGTYTQWTMELLKLVVLVSALVHFIMALSVEGEQMGVVKRP